MKVRIFYISILASPLADPGSILGILKFIFKFVDTKIN
jgi:hypothetical protein